MPAEILFKESEKSVWDVNLVESWKMRLYNNVFRYTARLK